MSVSIPLTECLQLRETNKVQIFFFNTDSLLSLDWNTSLSVKILLTTQASWHTKNHTVNINGYLSGIHSQ